MTPHVAPLLFAWVLVNQAGVPIPVVPSLLAAGALAAHTGTGLLMPVVVTVGAALVADLVWYGLGRWRGPQALAVLGRVSRRSAAHVENAERRFLAHQFGFLFSSRFLPELNPIAAGMAGATGIVLGRYILIGATSALAWAMVWTGSGYALGNVTDHIPTPFGFVTTLALLASAILAVCVVVKHRRRHAIVLVLLTMLAVAGCALGPDYKRPAVIEAAGWRTPTEGTGSQADLEWWQLFQHPVLRELIRTALDEDQDLRLAVAQVAEARAPLTVIRPAQFPQLDLQGSYTNQRFSQKSFSANALSSFPGTGSGFDLSFDAGL